MITIKKSSWHYKRIGYGIVSLIVLGLILGSYTLIPEGSRGVRTRFTEAVG